MRTGFVSENMACTSLARVLASASLTAAASLDRDASPVVDECRARGLLVEVDGLGEVDEVTQRVLTALA